MTSRRFVDLHTHTTASDGRLGPEDLLALADREKLAALAVTDHDTLDGLAAAAAAAENYPDLIYIPGIEVSAAFPRGTLHILGIGVDPDHAPLRQLADEFRAARDQRNPKMIAKLQALGLDVTMDDVRAAAAPIAPGSARGPAKNAPPIAPGSARGPAETISDRIISRVHMAEALRRKGYVKDNKDAFNRYLGTGCPGYVEKDRLAPAYVIETLRAAGGLAVLAHPVQLRCENHAQLERILRDLIRAGLNGIEAYHSDHTPAQTRHYLDLARRFHLAVTGGSDFHGEAKPTVKLGHPRTPLSAVPGELIERFRR